MPRNQFKFKKFHARIGIALLSLCSLFAFASLDASPSALLDVDQSGTVDATDGVLLLRKLNGASTIDTGVLLPTGQSNSTVLNTINAIGTKLDVDQSGSVDATDGVLILRKLNGASTIDTGVVLPTGQTNSSVVTTIDALVNNLAVINQKPTISSIANQTINVNTVANAINFTVGDKETDSNSLTVTASSSNKTLIPDANIALGGSGANRTVTVTPVSAQSGSATIMVVLSDSQSTDSTTFTVTVNELPTISSITSQTTDANTSTSAINFTIGDKETSAANLTLTTTSSNKSLVPDANISLGGSSASRTVTVKPASGQSGSATITITVNDGKSTTTTSFTITIAPQNQPPAMVAQSFTVNENSPNGTTVGTLVVTDPDVADQPNLTYSLTGSNAFVVDSKTGVITISNSTILNYETTPTFSLTATGIDPKGASATNAVTIKLANVNEAPVVTSADTFNFAENSTALAMTATATDIDSGDVISWSLTGTDAGLFTIDATTGAVAFKTAHDFESPTNKVYEINVVATDAGGMTQSKAVAVTVTNVNEAPVVTSAATASFVENGTGTVYTSTGTDVDTGDTIAWSLTGTDAGLFTINATTGAVIFKTAPDFEAPKDAGGKNVYNINVIATDKGGLTASKPLAITVTNVNEAPTISSMTNQTTAANTVTNAITFTVSDVETAAASLTVSGSSSNKTLVPDANIVFGGSGGSRMVMVTPASGQSGSVTITVTVNDGKTTANTNFAVTVSAPVTTTSITTTTTSSVPTTTIVPTTSIATTTSIKPTTTTTSVATTTTVPITSVATTTIVNNGSGSVSIIPSLIVKNRDIINQSNNQIVILRGIAFNHYMEAAYKPFLEDKTFNDRCNILKWMHTKNDYLKVKNMGFNTVRLYIGPAHIESECALLDLKNQVSWAKEAGLYLIIAYFAPPGSKAVPKSEIEPVTEIEFGLKELEGYYSDSGFWKDSQNKSLVGHYAKYLADWKKLATQFTKESHVLFELMNEPQLMFKNNADIKNSDILYSNTMKDAIEAIRKSEGAVQHIIIINGLNLANIEKDNFQFIDKISGYYKNLIYSFHYYRPMEFVKQGEYAKNCGTTPYQRVKLSSDFKNTIENDFNGMMELSKKYAVPFFLGEFGVPMKNENTTDSNMYFKTLTETAEHNGVSWALHAYRETFNLNIGVPCFRTYALYSGWEKSAADFEHEPGFGDDMDTSEYFYRKDFIDKIIIQIKLLDKVIGK